MSRPGVVTGWGPECAEFLNMFTYLKNLKGITGKELMLASFYYASPEYWTTKEPWNVPQFRFVMEQVFVWIKVYKMLEAADDREAFLERIGMTEEDVKALVYPLVVRANFPAIAAKLGKLEQYNKLVKS